MVFGHWHAVLHHNAIASNTNIQVCTVIGSSCIDKFVNYVVFINARRSTSWSTDKQVRSGSVGVHFQIWLDKFHLFGDGNTSKQGGDIIRHHDVMFLVWIVFSLSTKSVKLWWFDCPTRGPIAVSHVMDPMDHTMGLSGQGSLWIFGSLYNFGITWSLDGHNWWYFWTVIFSVSLRCFSKHHHQCSYYKLMSVTVFQ